MHNQCRHTPQFPIVEAMLHLVIMVALVAMLFGCADANTNGAGSTAEPDTGNATAPAPVTVAGRPEKDAANTAPLHAYSLLEAHEVDGRQGIACENGTYYVSGSTTLSRYGADWNLVASATDPFAGFDAEVNHIGDIDVYDGQIYAGVEYFMDGEAKNIQIAVYDANTFELVRTYPFDETSGQTEVSGIAVDSQNNVIWLCSWADGESGRYVYKYSLDDGSYLGKTHLQAPPQWIQGLACHDGWLYLTADDGTADLGEPDHVYRCSADVAKTAATVTLERTLDDVPMQGEIEGISFDEARGQMLISYNRGAQIVLGMPRGFYEGYESELHEVLVYEYAKEAGTLTSAEDLGLHEVDDTGSNYAFTYAGEEFQARYTEDNWKIIDSYRITNEADITLVCQALIDEHPIHGSDMESFRTAEDMAFEWMQHNYAWKNLPEESAWRQNAKDVDLDPADQGRTLAQMYEARTGRPFNPTEII